MELGFLNNDGPGYSICMNILSPNKVLLYFGIIWRLKLIAELAQLNFYSQEEISWEFLGVPFPGKMV